MTTWTQWAREIVITTIGTPELPGEDRAHPARESQGGADDEQDHHDERHGSGERRSSAAATTTSRKAMGASVANSCRVASVKVRFSTTPPVT